MKIFRLPWKFFQRSPAPAAPPRWLEMKIAEERKVQEAWAGFAQNLTVDSVRALVPKPPVEPELPVVAGSRVVFQTQDLSETDVAAREHNRAVSRALHLAGLLGELPDPLLLRLFQEVPAASEAVLQVLTGAQAFSPLPLELSPTEVQQLRLLLRDWATDTGLDVMLLPLRGQWVLVNSHEAQRRLEVELGAAVPNGLLPPLVLFALSEGKESSLHRLLGGVDRTGSALARVAAEVASGRPPPYQPWTGSVGQVFILTHSRQEDLRATLTRTLENLQLYRRDSVPVVILDDSTGADPAANRQVIEQVLERFEAMGVEPNPVYHLQNEWKDDLRSRWDRALGIEPATAEDVAMGLVLGRPGVVKGTGAQQRNWHALLTDARSISFDDDTGPGVLEPKQEVLAPQFVRVDHLAQSIGRSAERWLEDHLPPSLRDDPEQWRSWVKQAGTGIGQLYGTDWRLGYQAQQAEEFRFRHRDVLGDAEGFRGMVSAYYSGVRDTSASSVMGRLLSIESDSEYRLGADFVREDPTLRTSCFLFDRNALGHQMGPFYGFRDHDIRFQVLSQLIGDAEHPPPVRGAPLEETPSASFTHAHFRGSRDINPARKLHVEVVTSVVTALSETLHAARNLEAPEGVAAKSQRLHPQVGGAESDRTRPMLEFQRADVLRKFERAQWMEQYLRALLEDSPRWTPEANPPEAAELSRWMPHAEKGNQSALLEILQGLAAAERALQDRVPLSEDVASSFVGGWTASTLYKGKELAEAFDSRTKAGQELLVEHWERAVEQLASATGRPADALLKTLRLPGALMTWDDLEALVLRGAPMEKPIYPLTFNQEALRRWLNIGLADLDDPKTRESVAALAGTALCQRMMTQAQGNESLLHSFRENLESRLQQLVSLQEQLDEVFYLRGPPEEEPERAQRWMAQVEESAQAHLSTALQLVPTMNALFWLREQQPELFELPPGARVNPPKG